MGFTEFYSLDGKENVNKCSTPNSGENSLSKNKTTRSPRGVLTRPLWSWLPPLVDWSPLKIATLLCFSTTHTTHKVFNQYCKCRNHWMTGNGSLNWWLRETFLRHLQGGLTALHRSRRGSPGPRPRPVSFAVTQGGGCQWESVKGGDRRYVALRTAVDSAPQANSPVLLEVSFACIPHLLFSAT